MPDADNRQWVILGDVQMDETIQHPLALPIGPFNSHDEGFGFMSKMRPYWGEFEVKPITDPHGEAFRAPRPQALSYLKTLEPWRPPLIPMRGSQKEIIMAIIEEWEAPTSDQYTISKKLHDLLMEMKEALRP